MSYSGASQTFAGAITTAAITNVGIGLPKEREVGLIEGATNTITEAADRVASLVAQVRVIADATFGTQPQPGQPDSAIPPSVGRAENLQRAGSSLHSALSALDHEISRLRGL